MNRFISIVGRPEFSFELNKLEFDGLLVCVKNHYDATCRNMEEILKRSSRMSELEEIEDSFKFHTLLFRDLDIFCKCLESVHLNLLSKNITEDQANALHKLDKRLRLALQKANSFYKDWQHELIDKE